MTSPTPKLNVEFAEKWIAALRSGEYEQGAEYLRILGGTTRPDQFCCLGVACDLLVNDDKLPRWRTDEGSAAVIRVGDKYNTYTQVLPRRAILQIFEELDQKEADNYRAGWSVEIDGQIYEHLGAANDDGCTFAQIANAIEATLREQQSGAEAASCTGDAQ